MKACSAKVELMDSKLLKKKKKVLNKTSSMTTVKKDC